jgi:hypothetical protein
VKACVFLGPTLPAHEAARVLPAVYLPPASQGDVYRACCQGFAALGIIDGYFQQVPAVWHKEILWALHRGVRVFGSASMGALRAAEMARYGMEGVGEIFEAFRSGALEDDDEVALAHAPAEMGFRPLSEPMVNVRATLARAAAEGVLEPRAARALEALAKGLHYPERTYARLLAEGEKLGLPTGRLERWLPTGRVDLKRQDALAMLARMRAEQERGFPPPAPIPFEETLFWREAVRQA